MGPAPSAAPQSLLPHPDTYTLRQTEWGPHHPTPGRWQCFQKPRSGAWCERLRACGETGGKTGLFEIQQGGRGARAVPIHCLTLGES